MKPDIRFIAIDLDDTLLTDDNCVSERTIKAIQEVREKGIHVVIATGRMYETAKPVGTALHMEDLPMILYSGCCIQRVGNVTILYENPMSLASTKRILEMSKEYNWYLQMYIDDKMLIHHETPRSLAYVKATGATPHYVADTFYNVEKGPLKILMIDEQRVLDKAAQIITRELGQEVQAVRSKTTYLELIKKGCSKGDAMMAMAREWNIRPEQIMAIGNSQNDISMMQAAAISVAVGNAEENVKEIAHIITDSNNDDGVAKVLEQYILA